MRRRDFVAFLGGVAAALPIAAGAQQSARFRRVAMVMLYDKSDPEGQLRAAAFREGLERTGWIPDETSQ